MAPRHGHTTCTDALVSEAKQRPPQPDGAARPHLLVRHAPLLVELAQAPRHEEHGLRAGARHVQRTHTSPPGQTTRASSLPRPPVSLSLSLPPQGQGARKGAERTCTLAFMRTSRSCTSWKAPIGAPNCCRSAQYRTHTCGRHKAHAHARAHHRASSCYWIQSHKSAVQLITHVVNAHGQPHRLPRHHDPACTPGRGRSKRTTRVATRGPFPHPARRAARRRSHLMNSGRRFGGVRGNALALAAGSFPASEGRQARVSLPSRPLTWRWPAPCWCP